MIIMIFHSWEDIHVLGNDLDAYGDLGIRLADKDVISSRLDVESFSIICIMPTSPNEISCRNLYTIQVSYIFV